MTIPNRVRHELGIEPGTQLMIYTENGRLIAEHPDRMLDRVQGELVRARDARHDATDGTAGTEARP